MDENGHGKQFPPCFQHKAFPLKEKGKGKVGGKKGRLVNKKNLTCAKQNFK
jgi:hypothetical protein